MVLQLPNYENILTTLFASGIAVLAVVLIFLLIFLIIWLKIWAWAIKTRHGDVKGLGQVFVTLLISFIVAGLINQGFKYLLPSMALLGSILAFIIELVILVKRHNMTYVNALIAVILVIIVGIILLIVIGIILVVILLVVFNIALMAP